MRNLSSGDTPLFIRAGIDRSEVKVLNNTKDFENFKSTVGVSFSGYGFAEGETVIIPNLPIIPEAGEEGMKILSMPAYPGADENHRTYLLEVIRVKDGVERKSWLNLRRLAERSFVDQKYPDEFRESMATNYSNDFERLEYLRGGKIVSTGSTEMRRFKFDSDRNPVVDPETNARVEDTPQKVTTVEFEPMTAAKKK